MRLPNRLITPSEEQALIAQLWAGRNPTMPTECYWCHCDGPFHPMGSDTWYCRECHGSFPHPQPAGWPPRDSRNYIICSNENPGERTN